MRTFQGLYEMVENLFNDSTSTTTALAKQFINESYKKAIRIGSIKDEGIYYRLTSSGIKECFLPNDFDKMRTLKLIVADNSGTTDSTTANKLVDSTASFTASGTQFLGEVVGNTTDTTFAKITAVDDANTLSIDSDIFASGEGYTIANGTHYIGESISSEDDWNGFTQQSVEFESDVLRYYFIRNNKVELYPTPINDNQIIVMTYSKLINDMANDDYTTGTITINKGSTTVTGSGTTFAATMVGRYIRAASTGFWYRIASYTSTTVISLDRPFQETTVSGATYTIGEVPQIESQFHLTLTYEAIAFLYRKREDLTSAREYERLWKDAEKGMRKAAATKEENLQVRLRKMPRVVLDASKDKLVTIS